MTSPAVTHFIEPLSACFVPRDPERFELFGRQLIEDLASYSESVLKEAAGELRRTHKYPTWPTIAECVAAVERAAQRQYRPPAEKPRRPDPPPEQRARMIQRWKALSAEVDQAIAMDKPHRIFRSGVK